MHPITKRRAIERRHLVQRAAYGAVHARDSRGGELLTCPVHARGSLLRLQFWDTTGDAGVALEWKRTNDATWAPVEGVHLVHTSECLGGCIHGCCTSFGCVCDQGWVGGGCSVPASGNSSAIEPRTAGVHQTVFSDAAMTQVQSTSSVSSLSLGKPPHLGSGERLSCSPAESVSSQPVYARWEGFLTPAASGWHQLYTDQPGENPPQARAPVLTSTRRLVFSGQLRTQLPVGSHP